MNAIFFWLVLRDTKMKATICWDPLKSDAPTYQVPQVLLTLRSALTRALVEERLGKVESLIESDPLQHLRMARIL